MFIPSRDSSSWEEVHGVRPKKKPRKYMKSDPKLAAIHLSGGWCKRGPNKPKGELEREIAEWHTKKVSQ